jgi:hypothetical protein
MKSRLSFMLPILLAVAFALPASAQFSVIQKGPITGNVSGPSWGVDTLTGQAISATAHAWQATSRSGYSKAALPSRSLPETSPC